MLFGRNKLIRRDRSTSHCQVPLHNIPFLGINALINARLPQILVHTIKAVARSLELTHLGTCRPVNLGLPAIALREMSRFSSSVLLHTYCAGICRQWAPQVLCIPRKRHGFSTPHVASCRLGSVSVSRWKRNPSIWFGPSMIANLSAHVGLPRIASRYPSKCCCRWPQHWALVLIVAPINWSVATDNMLYSRRGSTYVSLILVNL